MPSPDAILAYDDDDTDAHDDDDTTPFTARQKIFTLLVVEDGEPTLVESHRTLHAAVARFMAILGEDSDFVEEEMGHKIILSRTVAQASNSVGDMMFIVERVL